MAGDLIVDRVAKTSVATKVDLVRGLVKAWVRFIGTGTVTIQDSFATAGITDNGTGNYNHDFAVTMTNANFAMTIGANTGGQAVGAATTTSGNLATVNSSGTATDAGRITTIIAGDLA